MKTLYIFIIGTTIFQGILSSKEKIPQEVICSKFTKIFYKIAIRISKKGYYFFLKLKENKIFTIDRKINEIEGRLISLYPLTGKRERSRLLLEFYIEKIKISIMVIFIGACIGITLDMNSDHEFLINDMSLARSEFGNGEKNIDLLAEVVETGCIEDVTIVLPERVYTQKELDALYEASFPILIMKLLGENENESNITNNLNFASEVEGYPFTIKWNVSNYVYINDSGELLEGIPINGTEIIVTVEHSYEGWHKEKSLKLKLYPTEKKSYTLKEQIEKQVLIAMENSREEVNLKLPRVVEGYKISWKQKPSYILLLLLAGIIITVIIINFAMEYDLKDRTEKREGQMIMDYPELVSKICLLLGAGMTVRTIFNKIGNDYEIKKKEGAKIRYTYEEIVVTCFELDSGISESKSYDNFARRCKHNKYLKFGSLLSQNLKKGSSQLQELLEAEAKTAFEDRKDMAKKRGEEAGTKLLLPMMLMMGVVMIIIIVPAFLTFNL